MSVIASVEPATRTKALVIHVAIDLSVCEMDSCATGSTGDG